MAKPHFDPLSIFADAGPSKSRKEEEDGDEDDFMSDKFLSSTTAPGLSKSKRRRLSPPRKERDTRPLREREEEARRIGLDRDLFAEAEIVAGGGELPPQDAEGRTMWDKLQPRQEEAPTMASGTNKALKMMLAMGYKRGQALGRHAAEQEEQVEEHESDEDSPDTDEETTTVEKKQDQRRQEDDYLSGGVTTEPIRMDDRWLGQRVRAGIGVMARTPASVSKAIAQAVEETKIPTEAELAVDYRSRVSAAHKERHIAALLVRARQTLMALDQAKGTEYSALWLDADLVTFLSGRSTNPEFEEKVDKDHALRQAVGLIEFAFEDEERGKEAESFCKLEPKTRLDLTLITLREDHSYCLFCGTQYSDKDEMNSTCPGTEEDDHD